MVKISVDDVKHIAKLVKLDVTGQEEKLAKMFSETLDYIQVLEELDTANVRETYQVTGLTDVFQKPNHPRETISQKEALKNASEEVNNLFATKAVFDR
jgi:aspartyl/glutamyl-tRNA(Asn/Gln) amidotransferase C subunit